MRSWTHVGRCWTNGEPFLALDADLLPDWSGETDRHYEELVPDLAFDVTSIPVDEGWLEVFRRDDGVVAVLQVAADDHPAAVATALGQPDDAAEPGDHVVVPSGRLAFVSAALDGAGVQAAPLSPERPGPVPASGAYDERRDAAGGPLLRATAKGFRIWVQWRTELDDGAAFARWLFTPTAGGIASQ